MAWTKLFHAHFNNTIGDKYYYKTPNGRYKLVDGDKKTWELSTCINNFKALSEPVKTNLEFFIRLRNKIEHRHIDKREVDTLIFGECQSLLFNYENQLIHFFGNHYSINEALVYSLQFSQLRTKQQEKASKSALSSDLAEIVSFVGNYRNNLSDEIFNSLEYSIKLIQIPKISNTNRADAAIEFVKWDELSDEDRSAFDKISVIIKDKRVTIEAANVKRIKPGEVVSRVNKILAREVLSTNLNAVLFKLFNIRPSSGADDPFETNSEFCLYDETHNDYVYQEAWVEYLANFFQTTNFTPNLLRVMEKQGQKLNIDDYRV